MLLILGFLVSGLISLIILNNQRSQLGSGIANFFTRLNAKIDANSRKEDSGD
jgi:Flp pilus assembly pilin Flp